MTFFVITIDTEEDMAWQYEKTVKNIQAVPKFQELCNLYHIKPTYLVTYPVASSESGVKILRKLLRSGNCEIGTHLHPWINPPFIRKGKTGDLKYTYPSNLPLEIFQRKLSTLTDQIKDAFGVRPTSYRAGRYGISREHIHILEKQGYIVDTSVAPYHDDSLQGGPCFGYVPLKPYHPNHDNLLAPGGSSLLEVPITVYPTRRISPSLRKLYWGLPNTLKWKSLLTRLGILKLSWLRPSLSSLEDMKKITDHLVKSKAPVLNMMFHSSELMAGANPYNRTAADVQQFLEKIDDYFTYLEEKDISGQTLSEFAKSYENNVSN